MVSSLVMKNENNENNPAASPIPETLITGALLEVFERFGEDIFTSVEFLADGGVDFKVEEDGVAFDDFADSTAYRSVRRSSVSAADREMLFAAFLDPVPATELERRAALVEILKAEVKKSYIRPLLESRGVPFVKVG